MHYAVAIAFWERQRLERYFTDIYLPFECKFLAGVAGETVGVFLGETIEGFRGLRSAVSGHLVYHTGGSSVRIPIEAECITSTVEGFRRK